MTAAQLPDEVESPTVVTAGAGAAVGRPVPSHATVTPPTAEPTGQLADKVVGSAVQAEEPGAGSHGEAETKTGGEAA